MQPGGRGRAGVCPRLSQDEGSRDVQEGGDRWRIGKGIET